MFSLFRGEKRPITLIPFICDTLDELPVLSEHVDFKWISPEDLGSVDFCEADIYVAENYLVTVTRGINDKEHIIETDQSKEVDKELQQMINNMMSRQEAEWVATSAIDNESTERSFLRILSMTDLRQLSEQYHGILADHCFKALNSGSSAIAIKAYSMEIIYRLAIIYPNLANELSSSINMLQGEGAAAGIIVRGIIILKKLAEISSDRESSQL